MCFVQNDTWNMPRVSIAAIRISGLDQALEVIEFIQP